MLWHIVRFYVGKSMVFVKGELIIQDLPSLPPKSFANCDGDLILLPTRGSKGYKCINNNDGGYNRGLLKPRGHCLIFTAVSRVGYFSFIYRGLVTCRAGVTP